MPIYEYQCQSCGSKSEVMQRVGDPPPGTCNECGGELRKLLSAPAFQFKGSGWYVTDYARKSEGKTDGSSKDSSKDSKPETSSGGESSAKTTETATKPSTPTSSSS